MDPDTCEVLGMSTSYGYDPNNPMDTDALRNMTVTVTEDVKEDTTETTGGDTSEDTTEVTTEEQKEPEQIKYDFSEMTDEEFEKTIADLTSDQKYEALNAVWRNYCISDILEPGSTFKPFTIAGALEDGVIQDGQTFYCKGYEVVAEGTDPIFCHNREGDGTLTLKQALEQSCNAALMQIAKAEGSETFAKYQDIFNFGKQTGIDLSGEESGLVYDEESLNPVELATSSFGQGINVTMIQMAAAFCSLINGGNYYTPHTVRQILDEDGSIIENNEPELVRKTVSKKHVRFDEKLYGRRYNGRYWFKSGCRRIYNWRKDRNSRKNFQEEMVSTFFPLLDFHRLKIRRLCCTLQLIRRMLKASQLPARAHCCSMQSWKICSHI